MRRRDPRPVPLDSTVHASARGAEPLRSLRALLAAGASPTPKTLEAAAGSGKLAALRELLTSKGDLDLRAAREVAERQRRPRCAALLRVANLR